MPLPMTFTLGLPAVYSVVVGFKASIFLESDMNTCILCFLFLIEVLLGNNASILISKFIRFDLCESDALVHHEMLRKFFTGMKNLPKITFFSLFRYTFQGCLLSNCADVVFLLTRRIKSFRYHLLFISENRIHLQISLAFYGWSFPWHYALLH